MIHLDDDDYIVEMGANWTWAMKTFYFKTKKGFEGVYGHDSDKESTFEACDTSDASNPMIIAAAMSEHFDIINYDSMQAIKCHYVDLDDF